MIDCSVINYHCGNVAEAFMMSMLINACSKCTCKKR